MTPSDTELQRAIVELLGRRSPAATICPSEVARLMADAAEWRALMPRVREQAGLLAAQQRLRITRRGATIEPAELHRGAIRLGRGPRFDDPRASAGDSASGD